VFAVGEHDSHQQFRSLVAAMVREGRVVMVEKVYESRYVRSGKG
jgi:hypothetical protein